MSNVEAGPLSSDFGALVDADEPVGAFAGFAVDIAIDGDDVVLDWSAAGYDPNEYSATLVRSTVATQLIGLPPDGVTPPAVELFPIADAATSTVDAGAADRAVATPTYYYRVVLENAIGDIVASTMMVKVSTPAATGYTLFGLCMLDGPQTASDVDAMMGESDISVHLWNPATQSWRWWWSDQDAGPFGDFELPLGGVVIVNFNSDVPAFVSMAGVVPTGEAVLEAGPGINHLTMPVMGGPPLGTAAGLVDELGWYEAIGVWDAAAQSLSWYEGPGDTDFALGACMPYKFKGKPHPCSSAMDCGADKYCKFKGADMCGAMGEGVCTKLPSDPCPVGGDGVCGCDGFAYANWCDAAAAGVSVGAPGDCEPPPTDCPCVEASPAWFGLASGAIEPIACVFEETTELTNYGAVLPGGSWVVGGYDESSGEFGCVASDPAAMVVATEEQAQACTDLVVESAGAAGIGCGPL